VEACGNRFVVSKELWTRSVRPQLRQLPQGGFAAKCDPGAVICAVERDNSTVQDAAGATIAAG